METPFTTLLVPVPGAAPPRRERTDLDVLRGLAAACMVIHHAWARFGPALSPAGDQLVFLGSCAPVLFFFVTGLGYGVQKDRRGPITAASVKKVLILLAAGQLMAWRDGHLLGLDFLGFIALSALALEGVARSRRAVGLALGVAAAAVMVRFGLASGSVLVQLPPDVAALTAITAGARAAEGVSYQLAPWLAYPMLGFVLGRRLRAGLEREAAITVSVVGALALLFSLALGDAIVFRWGAVSLAFFARSFVALALAILAAVALDRAPWVRRWLALRGVASLALVPLHYVVLAVAAAAGLGPFVVDPARGPLGLLALLAAAIAASFVLSNGFAAAAQRLHARVRVGLAAPVAIAAACGAALLLAAPGDLAATLLMAAGQLALCAALVAPDPARGEARVAAGDSPTARPRAAAPAPAPAGEALASAHHSPSAEATT